MNLRVFFLFFILLLSVYQDFPLVNVFGKIARSPIVFLTPLLLLYLLKNSKIQISVYTKYLTFYILYLIIITIIYLLWIFIIYKQEALKTFNFIILWMTIHGVGTNLVPLIFKQVQLTKKQIIGFKNLPFNCKLLFIRCL